MLRFNTLPRLAAAALLATTSCAILLPAPSAYAAGAGDITSQVLAGTNVTLTGDSIINLPSGTTTYNGQFSGQGTLTVAGSGTLVLTKDSDFTLPSADQRQSVSTSGGNWPYPIIANPDAPAVIVEHGATLQYGNGGSTGIIGDYPYTSISSPTLNHDNVEVDGTLILDIANREYNLGTISGNGLVSQPRSTWGTWDLADDQPFTGTISNGTGTDFGGAAFRLSLPHATAVDNDGSAIIGARNYTLVLPENFYEDQYGSDINFHTWQAGLIEMAGVDHYIDPSEDTASIAHTSNFRGINIEGANVQWGDGATSRFFLPATPSDSYINIHKNGSLTFDYDGPVTLDTPISGGVYHASLSTPADASITLAATQGNAVTFAVPMNYHGPTTIGQGATLLLGTGESGGDSSLLTGATNDKIVDDGTLTVRNTGSAVTLANISGSGALTQQGKATTTLSGTTAYTGSTTVAAGTLALGNGAGGIGDSSSLSLTGSTAVFDVSAVGGSSAQQSVRQLSGVAGSKISLGTSTMTVSTTGATTYAGDVTGTSGGITTSGTGTLTLTGHASTPNGAWHLNQGTLALGKGGALDVGSLIQADSSTLSLDLTNGADSPTTAPIQVSGTAQLAGTLTVTAVPQQLAADGRIVLVHSTSSSASAKAITGTFAGLPQGAKINASGRQFTIDYAADGGHDVVLTASGAAAASGTQSAAAANGARAASAGGGTSLNAGNTAMELAGAATAAALIAAAAITYFARSRKRRTADPVAGPVAGPVVSPLTGPVTDPGVQGQARRHRRAK